VGRLEVGDVAGGTQRRRRLVVIGVPLSPLGHPGRAGGGRGVAAGIAGRQPQPEHLGEGEEGLAVDEEVVLPEPGGGGERGGRVRDDLEDVVAPHRPAKVEDGGAAARVVDLLAVRQNQPLPGRDAPHQGDVVLLPAAVGARHPGRERLRIGEAEAPAESLKQKEKANYVSTSLDRWHDAKNSKLSDSSEAIEPPLNKHDDPAPRANNQSLEPQFPQKAMTPPLAVEHNGLPVLMFVPYFSAKSHTTTHHLTLRLELAILFPLATAVKSIWYSTAFLAVLGEELIGAVPPPLDVDAMTLCIFNSFFLLDAAALKQRRFAYLLFVSFLDLWVTGRRK